MRRNYGGGVGSFWLWFGLHAAFGVLAGAYYASEKYGLAQPELYYIPPFCGAVIAGAAAALSYFILGFNSPERNIRLGDFDRMMIYSRFGGGRNAKMLKEAVIDMHLCDYNDALDVLKEIEEDEEDTEENNDTRLSVVYFYIGRCYQLMGYPSNGAKYLLEAVDKGLKLNDTYLLAARCLTQNGSFDRALECYNTLLERNCCYEFVYTDMGIAYLKKGDGEKALEYFTRSLNEGKNYSFALGGCSLAYLQMKNLEESTKYYQKALMCNMDDVNGFKVFYCNIAEAVGLWDEIDPKMKLRSRRGFDIEDEEIIR